MKPTVSQALYEQACQVLPGGVSRNTIFRTPHPFYAEKGFGCRVTDVEGVERIDFTNNMAALIHGHAHPAIVSAVGEQLQRGSAFTMATEAEVRCAQHLCSRSLAFDKIRFMNSGTEAVMAGLKAARAFTGRAKIAKVEGAYHGAYDYAEVSQTASPANWGTPEQPSSVPVAAGTPQGALDDVVVIPFNDPETAVTLLNRHAGEIAAVLLDPMPHRVGLIPADRNFVHALRQWCDVNDAVFILDEVITFRSTYGGAQAWFDAQPDLTALGKVIGGGFPAGALAGRDEIMQVFDPQQAEVRLPHSGTFSANPITMTAGRVAMELFDPPAVERLNALGDYARRAIHETIAEVGVGACVTGAGSLLRIHLKPEIPTNYRSTYMGVDEAARVKFLVDHFYDHGIMVINTCTAALSTAMTEAEIDTLVEVLRTGLVQLRGRI
jgi:glutamate-1-semialdehyde 2,1-aminomutase